MLFSAITLSLLILTLLINVNGQDERTGGAILDFNFLLEDCVDGNAFPPLQDALQGGSFQSRNVGSPSFQCPSIDINGNTFLDASNGFTTGGGNAEGLESDNNLGNPAALEGVAAQTFEFWVFIPSDYNPADEGEILLEIARDPGGSNVNDWIQGTDFFTRISMTSSDIFFRSSTLGANADGNDAVRLFDARNNVTDVGGLVHIVITRRLQGTFTTTDFFINSELADTNSVNVAADSNLLNFNGQLVKVVLGGSFGLEQVQGLGVSSLTAVLQKVAIYPFQLSQAQIDANFAAGVENSPPSILTQTIDHDEDTTTEITFRDFVFDFDNDIRGFSDQDEVVVQIVRAPDGDKGNLNVAIEVDIDLDATILYDQVEENDDQDEDTFDYKAIQNAPEELESVVRTFTLDFQETNDEPEGAENLDEIVAELQTLVTTLKGADPLDSGNGRERVDFLPVTAELNADPIITQIVGVPVAKAFKCSDVLEADLALGDTFALAVDPNDADSFITTDVCIRAGFFDNQVNAELGTVDITFDVIDGQGARSSSADRGRTTITILQALSAGCIFINQPNCETDIIEELSEDDDEEDESAVGGVSFELQLFDSRCDGDDLAVEDQDETCLSRTPCDDACFENCRNDPDNCAVRIKQGAIVAPLPDPDLEGSLFFVDLQGNEVQVTEELLNDNSGRAILPILTGTDFAEFNNRVIFRAVEDYFNLAPFPVCVNTRNVDFDRAQCIDIANGEAAQRCFGEFCESGITGFTTGVRFGDDLENEDDLIPFGFCKGEERIDFGCPVRISHETFVGGGFSFDRNNQVPSHVLWIKNVNSKRASLVIADAFDLFINQQIKFDPPIQVDSPEGNAQTLRVSLSVNNDGFLRIANFGDFNVEADSLTFLDIDSNFGTGIQDGAADNGFLIGFGDRINEFLEELTVELVNENSELTVLIQSPFEIASNVNQDRFTRDLVASEEPGDGQGAFAEIAQRAEFIAACIFFCLVCSFCCYKCFEKDTFGCVYVMGNTKIIVVKGAAKAGLAKDRHTRDKFDHDSDSDHEKELGHDVESGHKYAKKKKKGYKASSPPSSYRGKKKQKVAQSYRKKGASERSEDSSRYKKKKKKSPVQSHRDTEDVKPKRANKNHIPAPKSKRPAPKSRRNRGGSHDS